VSFYTCFDHIVHYFWSILEHSRDIQRICCTLFGTLFRAVLAKKTPDLHSSEVQVNIYSVTWALGYYKVV
jgi:hypothetical protein